MRANTRNHLIRYGEAGFEPNVLQKVGTVFGCGKWVAYTFWLRKVGTLFGCEKWVRFDFRVE
jgi:hypothetical protein